MASAGKKKRLFLVSACQLNCTKTVLSREECVKKFPFTVSPACCSESCLAEMQTWEPPVGVCRDCIVLLLGFSTAEWAEGQKHSKGDDPWAICHRSSTERGRGVFFLTCPL